MRTISLQDLAMLQSDSQTWAVCWMVQKLEGYDSNGEPIYSTLRQTGHDRELEVSRTVNGIDLSGTYTPILSVQSSAAVQGSMMDVDNLDVDVLLNQYGITAADIRAGLFDDVTCTLFIVNWSDTTNSGILIQHGIVGNFRSFVEGLATGELRGLKQYLQQTIINAYSLSCRVKVLGDAQCKVDVAPLQAAGTITAVLGPRSFEVSISANSEQGPGYFVGGLMQFTSGLNDGFKREVKHDGEASDAIVGQIDIFDAFPYAVSPGDSFILEPGCDRMPTTCKDKFDNIVNFRGEPFIPGPSDLLRGAQ